MAREKPATPAAAAELLERELCCKRDTYMP